MESDIYTSSSAKQEPANKNQNTKKTPPQTRASTIPFIRVKASTLPSSFWNAIPFMPMTKGKTSIKPKLTLTHKAPIATPIGTMATQSEIKKTRANKSRFGVSAKPKRVKKHRHRQGTTSSKRRTRCILNYSKENTSLVKQGMTSWT